MAAVVNDAVFGDIHHFHKLGSRKIESAARRQVFRIASNPERVQAKTASHGQQQAERAARVFVAAMQWMNGIADVAGILSIWRVDATRRLMPPSSSPVVTCSIRKWYAGTL